MRIQKINHREHREHRGITEKIIFARSAVYSLFSVSISVFSVFSVFSVVILAYPVNAHDRYM